MAIAFYLMAGCASGASPADDENKIPIIKPDGSVEYYTATPTPLIPGRILFCIEWPTMAVCVSEEGGRAQRYYFPRESLDPTIRAVLRVFFASASDSDADECSA